MSFVVFYGKIDFLLYESNHFFVVCFSSVENFLCSMVCEVSVYCSFTDMDDFPVTVFTPSRNDALLFFRGHTDLVFNVELSPSGRFAVSGGKDDRGWLWKAEDGSPILELTGFKDSVPYVGFSHDEKFVMAADMAGNVRKQTHTNIDIIFILTKGF